MKKVLSVICSAVIMLTAVMPIAAAEVKENAVHSEGFSVKENFEFYDSLSEGGWTTSHNELSLSLDSTGAAYGGSGKALKCDYDFTNVSDTLSFYKNSFIYNEDINGNPLGEGSKLSFWVRSENAITLKVRFVDGSDYINYTVTTNNISVPAGESVITLNMTDFIPNKDTVHHDFYAIYQLQFLFKPSTADKTGYLYLDEIGIYEGEATERLHGTGAAKANLNSTKWINKNSNSNITSLSQSPRYYNDGIDTEALEIDYTSITSSAYPDFYYNDGIRCDLSAETVFGENTVLSFWTYSSQPVKLGLTYMDSSITKGQLVQCGYKEIKIPKGESIVNIPMKALAPAGQEMQYKWAYQLQLSVLPIGSSADKGKLYIDSFAFYSTETDRLLSEKLDGVDTVSIETAAAINEIIDFEATLSEKEKGDITSYTLSRYNALKARYDTFAPYISEIKSDEGTEYDRGTLSFLTVLENAQHTGFKVKEIGSVIYRKALLTENTPLTLDTPDSLRAGEKIVSVKNKYDINIILKSLHSSGTYTGDGYYGTTYIARPYVIYEKSNGEKFTVYGNAVNSKSADKTAEQQNNSKAFDKNSETSYTAPKSGENTIIYHFGEEKTFNSICFNEASAEDSLITHFTLLIPDSLGRWTEIYSQDEMGKRKAILDAEYKADKVKLIIKSDGIAAIGDISFETAVKTGNSAKYSSYYTAAGSNAAQIKADAAYLECLTDVILFDYGSWNTKGEFNFKAESGGEANLAAAVNAINSLDKHPDIWFCLQNYDKNEISEIVLNESVTEAEAKNRLLATNAVRQKLIDFCLDLCDNYGLAGVDIDYEYPSNSTQWANYAVFIKELGAALHNKGYKLSIAMSGWGVNNHFDSAAVASIDYINVMSYDGEDTDKRGMHSTYAKAVNDINYFKDLGFSPSQLILGLAFYGKPMDGTTDYVSYNKLTQRYFDGISRNRNIYGRYFCPGAALTADKTYLALTEGLAGVFSWTFMQDYALDDTYSLNKAVTDTINKYGK